MTNTVSNPQSRMELLALAERVEKATGADREIDGAIDRLFHDRPNNGDYDEAERAIWREVDSHSGLLVRGDGFARGSFCASDYTASIDAAMTLAEGQGWCGGAIALLREAMDRMFLAGLGIEALPRFLTAACLRSIAAMEGE